MKNNYILSTFYYILLIMFLPIKHKIHEKFSAWKQAKKIGLLLNEFSFPLQKPLYRIMAEREKILFFNSQYGTLRLSAKYRCKHKKTAPPGAVLSGSAGPRIQVSSRPFFLSFLP